MLFNSIEYALFLPIVFLIYWFVVQKNLKFQNFFVLIVSYIFYGWWDWRFLSLIVFSSIIDFLVGLKMGKTETPKHRKYLLWVSLAVNLGLLGFFKYYNFFVEQFITAFSGIGIALNPTTLNVILPVGISFYTFQTLSYTIDIYRKQLEPVRDWVAFFAYVSFFPQLVAGPIERATNLIPQFLKPRHFEYEKAKDGMRQILWGLFKKVVIADNCALLVNDIFENYETLGAPALILGSVLFAFQIYCDFSGYSDIAIGTARLFGFNLMQNFAFPYFSRDIAEFWRRWHISLSTWFRDYLYIPLGGSRVDSQWKLVRNVAAIFIVSGFWHGANWTFIVWGTLHALFFLPNILLNKNRRYLGVVAENKWLPNFSELFKILMTFALVCISWIFFRAENMTHAMGYFGQMLQDFSVNVDLFKDAFFVLFGIGILLIIEWCHRDKQHGFQFEEAKVPQFVRGGVYILTALAIVLFAPSEGSSFIYFQF